MSKSYKEIVKLPSERKLWLLRKYYAGGKGALPPTDPRILSLTPEQIALEFERIEYDEKLKSNEGNHYEDEEYDKYDEESDAYDRNSTDGVLATSEENNPIEVNYDEWDEIDD